MNACPEIPARPQADWLAKVAAPIWQMLTGIGQLRAGETVRIVGGTERERAFATEAAELLGADTVLAEADAGEAQLVLLLDGPADLDLVAGCGRIVLRAGALTGHLDAARIAARGMTVRGLDAGLWAERHPEQLREIVAALESCRASRAGPLVTLSHLSIGDAL